MKKLKSALQRITMGVLALVFTVTLAVPKAKAVTGVDDVSVGIMAVLVHLDSIGGSLAVQQGTALATQNAVTALATQAGAAGALGAGVTGTAALATIGGAVVAAAAGGFTIGYVGYETLSKLAEWIRQSRLTGTAENKIYQTGGSFETRMDGLPLNNVWNGIGKIYSTQAGSSYLVNLSETAEKGVYNITMIGLTTSDESRIILNETIDTVQYPWHKWNENTTMYRIVLQNENKINLLPDTGQYPSAFTTNEPLTDIFYPSEGTISEKQEVTYVPPATWAPPAPTPGQDVYYNPYPQMPQKPIKEIVEDVPKDIYDKRFDPAPPQVIDPTVPPVNPDLPPDLPPVVNPNPPVDPPAEVQPYTVQLGDVFPFCIPFDLYHMVTLFVAEPEAPHAKWEFSLPFAAGTYKVEWDLQEWDEVAALCRKLELILFCVGLAVVTSKLIKW